MDLPMDSLFTEEARLKTYTSWPYDDDKKCNKRKMAEAGFAKTGGHDEIDLAECFLCGKQMNGWEEHDDPWEEHKSHAPYCLFAQIGKAEENLNYKERVKIMIELKKNTLKKEMEAKMSVVKDSIKEFEFQAKLIR